jgi:hypothetical protein
MIDDGGRQLLRRTIGRWKRQRERGTSSEAQAGTYIPEVGGLNCILDGASIGKSTFTFSRSFVPRESTVYPPISGGVGRVADISLTGFHLLWDKILSQNLQAVADQGC